MIIPGAAGTRCSLMKNVVYYEVASLVLFLSLLEHGLFVQSLTQTGDVETSCSIPTVRQRFVPICLDLLILAMLLLDE